MGNTIAYHVEEIIGVGAWRRLLSQERTHLLELVLHLLETRIHTGSQQSYSNN